MTASINIVFCEDIRQEHSFKIFLIGVYPDDLVPSFLPQVIHFSIWVKISNIQDGQYVLTSDIGFDSEVQHSIESPVKVEANQQLANLYLLDIPIHVMNPGEIFCRVKGVPGVAEFTQKLRVLNPIS